jgi:hypothetical protein
MAGKATKVSDAAPGGMDILVVETNDGLGGCRKVDAHSSRRLGVKGRMIDRTANLARSELLDQPSIAAAVTAAGTDRSSATALGADGSTRAPQLRNQRKFLGRTTKPCCSVKPAGGGE